MKERTSPFMVEWECVYIGDNYYQIRTKEKLFRPGQLKKDRTPVKGAKPQKLKMLREQYKTMAKHLVLCHNMLVREREAKGEGISQIITEHIERQAKILKSDILFYLGIEREE